MPKKSSKKGKKGAGRPAKAKAAPAKVVEDASEHSEEEADPEVNEDVASEESEDDGPPPAKKEKATPEKKAKSGPASKKAKGKPSKKPTQTKKSTKNDDSEDDEEEEKEYEVDSIIDVHIMRNNKREFLVKWVGYKKSDATWEPEDNLDCGEKVDAFLKKLDLDYLPRTGFTRRLSTSRTTKISTKTHHAKEAKIKKPIHKKLNTSKIYKKLPIQKNLSISRVQIQKKRLKYAAAFSAASASLGLAYYFSIQSGNSLSFENIPSLLQQLISNFNGLLHR